MLTLLTPPTTQPVSLAEAKLAAKVGAAFDGIVPGLIITAREAAEQITQRCYMTQVRRYTSSCWPSACEPIHVHAATAVAISYWNGSAWVALDSSAFAFDELGCWTGVAPALGTSWPTLGDKAIGPRVRIDLTAGAADAASVPESVKTFIKAQVAAWIDTPEAQRVSQQLTPNPLFLGLLDGERLWG